MKRCLRGPKAVRHLAVTVEQGKMVTSHADVIAELDGAWSSFFQRPPKQLTPFLHDLIGGEVRQQFQPAPLDAEHLKMVLQAANQDSSPGVDQWRYSDLVQLPRQALEELACLYAEIERQSRWPRQLEGVWLSVIAEKEPLPPLKHRPISVLPTLVRLWGSARLRTIEGWTNEILPESSYAYRRAKSAEQAALHLQAEFEKAQAQQLPSWVGASLDLSKAFPSTSRDILAAFWRQTGGPESVLQTLLSFYTYSPVRWRILGRIISGHQFYFRTGLHQGCAMSVASFNLATMPLLKEVARRLPEVIIVAYADDITFMAPDPTMLQAAVSIGREICTGHGLEAKWGKDSILRMG